MSSGRPLLLFAIFAGCGGAPADLSPSAVSSIPPGNAIGGALSGHYSLQRVTRACSGACGGVLDGLPISVCDVGAVQTIDADVAEAGGTVDVQVNDTPAIYHGSLDSDGAIDVGGYATQDAMLQITVRLTGTMTPGRVTGQARSHSWGNLAGVNLDCIGSYDVTPAS